MLPKPTPSPLATALGPALAISIVLSIGSAAACSRTGPAPGSAAAQPWVVQPSLAPQVSGTTALLIAISIVDRDTVWASGARGTWVRTTDGGATWTAGTVPGADSLQFRDIHAIDSRVAWVLSIGNGPQSRIYRTDDGGTTWSLQFTNPDANAFYDCFGFWDARHGIAFSDSHNSAFSMIETTDGATWSPIPADRLPAAAEGEGGFASSGTCLVVEGDSAAFVGTGASPGSGRVLRTTDRGRTWSFARTPVYTAQGAGISTLALAGGRLMSAIGGDIGTPGSRVENVAISRDGGATWTAAAPTPFAGAAYGSSWIPAAPAPALVAVGPGGVAWSVDAATTWMMLDTLNHWGVAFAAPDAGWAVGPGGRISRIAVFERER